MSEVLSEYAEYIGLGTINHLIDLIAKKDQNGNT